MKEVAIDVLSSPTLDVKVETPEQPKKEKKSKKHHKVKEAKKVEEPKMFRITGTTRGNLSQPRARTWSMLALHAQHGLDLIRSHLDKRWPQCKHVRQISKVCAAESTPDLR